MFTLGALIIGWGFALTTLISSFYYPIILGIFQKIPFLAEFTSDRLLSVIFAGLMIGLSIGIVIRAGASTGGMDIPPLILNKKFGLNISVMLYVFDFLILLGQAVFSDKEAVLYGILLVLIYSIVLNKILLIGSAQTQVKIVSKHFEEINTAIIGRLDRGSTLLHAETGFFRDEQSVVLTVVSNRELNKLNELVTQIDPECIHDYYKRQSGAGQRIYAAEKACLKKMNFVTYTNAQTNILPGVLLKCTLYKNWFGVYIITHFMRRCALFFILKNY